MGYTHYYGFSPKYKLSKQSLNEIQDSYDKAINKCNKVIRHYSATYGGLSGYSAYTTTRKYKGIKLNGSKNSGICEDFVLPELIKDLNSESTKTNRYLYDTVVVACLIILSNEVDNFVFKSDGRSSDLIEGLELARLITGRKYNIPESIRTDIFLVG